MSLLSKKAFVRKSEHPGGRAVRGLRFFIMAFIIGATLTLVIAAIGVRQYQAAQGMGGFSKSMMTRSSGTTRSGDGRLWLWTADSRFAVSWVQFNAQFSVGTGASSPMIERAPASWSHSEQAVSGLGLSNFDRIDRLEVGWPMHSFLLIHASYADGLPMSGGKTVAGFDLMDIEAKYDWAPDWFASGRVGYSILPTFSIWPGLLVNLAFWSALSFGLLSLPRGYQALRAARRLRHGLCSACGYELSSGPSGHKVDPCPECGHRAVVSDS